MTGIERVDPGFKLLAVAARMHGVADIVVPENGQACNCVADAIVGLTQGLLAKKTIGGRGRRKWLHEKLEGGYRCPAIMGLAGRCERGHEQRKK